MVVVDPPSAPAGRRRTDPPPAYARPNLEHPRQLAVPPERRCGSRSTTVGAHTLGGSRATAARRHMVSDTPGRRAPPGLPPRRPKFEDRARWSWWDRQEPHRGSARCCRLRERQILPAEKIGAARTPPAPSARSGQGGPERWSVTPPAPPRATSFPVGLLGRARRRTARDLRRVWGTPTRGGLDFGRARLPRLRRQTC
ncbi:hypothetical protein BJ989_003110 [Nocardioides perillae]|uniref:Uncharacterized protein n=1 Tax=Nocardioides perillae TaxID=1119534 RepID=A0A7Y9RWQ0_9ACTN|nr:hypothetical protein [Nocardioides perillae]